MTINNPQCGECLCRVCARNEASDNYNALCEHDCYRCNDCKGVVVDTEEDCPRGEFVPDEMNENMWSPVKRKPPLGVRPAWVAAWQRIGELAEGIVRQYESNNGDVDLVQLWSKEIDVQCRIINVAKCNKDIYDKNIEPPRGGRSMQDD